MWHFFPDAERYVLFSTHIEYPDTTKPYTLYTDASKYGWAGVLTQSHTSTVDGKSVTMDHLISYVSSLFHGSQLNWAALTKEAYAIYMSVKIYSIKEFSPDGLIPSTLCKAHRTYIWHTHINALDDPTRSSGAPGYGIRPVHTLTWYNQLFFK